MKKALVLISALALSACAMADGKGPTTANISDTAKQIQAYTKTFCSFVPTIATIAAIVSRGSSATLAGYATDICQAVTTAPLADGGPRQAKVNGVVVRGKFVR